jgi:hypothetical protein
MEGMVKMVIFMLAFVGFSTSSKESARMGIRIILNIEFEPALLVHSNFLIQNKNNE